LIDVLGGCVKLQQFFELLDREPSVADDTAECECVDRIMPWDGEDARAVGHNDVLALARDVKPAF
jgi:hypothetical protein